MAGPDLVRALQVASRAFGRRAATEKLHLLRDLADLADLRVTDLVALQDACNFLRAYPDDAKVRSAARKLVPRIRQRVEAAPGLRGLGNTGLPGAWQQYAYSYGELQQLRQRWPGACEIAWDDIDDVPLIQALRHAAPPNEVDGLDDERLSLREWLVAARSRRDRTDLDVVLRLLESAGHAEAVQVDLFERADVPVRFDLRRPALGRCEVEIAGTRGVWQTADIPRDKFPLAPLITETLPAQRPVSAAAARELLAASHAALCARNLEIYPLIYANPRDVWRVACPRGLDVVLVGTRDPFRAPLESLYFFLVCKNGVPLGYGPAGVFAGACEMGINLFPEFRGAEIRFVWAQIMRVLHHVLGADYFFLQAYGMGLNNPDAIKSGAFWFYRKLGFSAENPEVESLAREEERRMRDYPGYRSDVRTLHRLKYTRAYLDLSDGRHRWTDFAALNLGVTRLVARRHHGDRGAAHRECARTVARALGISTQRWSAPAKAAFAQLAPLLALIPDLKRWPAADRKALARACKAKGAPSEAAACRAFATVRPLTAALRAAALEHAPEE